MSNFGLTNQNKMWVINGSAIKVEGNLVPNVFTITEIPETGIWFGPYAVHNNEFDLLRQRGITQIINMLQCPKNIPLGTTGSRVTSSLSCVSSKKGVQ